MPFIHSGLSAKSDGVKPAFNRMFGPNSDDTIIRRIDRNDGWIVKRLQREMRRAELIVSGSGQIDGRDFCARVRLKMRMESKLNIDGPSLPSVSARRREIFERTQAKYAGVGIHLDDPEYLNLIEKWIVGDITMPEAAARWDQARRNRKPTTAQLSADIDDVDLESLPKMTQEQILMEIAKLTE